MIQPFLDSQEAGNNVVIGVTGHRDLRESDIPLLSDMVAGQLKKLQDSNPQKTIIMLNSIASGADMLCAEEALKLGIALVCPLPMEVNDYRRDFEGMDIARFEVLVKKAGVVFVAPDTELATGEPNRDFHYRQAGIYVASHCDVLIALWNGQPGTAYGCGTAETVDFMLKGRNCEGQVFRPATGPVIHIITPRASQKQTFPIGVRMLGND